MIDKRIKCPECNGEIIKSMGQYVCRNCGLVIDLEIVSNDYLLNNSNDLNNKYTQSVSLGERPNIIDGLGSYIGHYNEHFFSDSRGKRIPPKLQKNFSKLKRIYDIQSRYRKKETRYRALRTLNQVAKMLMVSTQVRDRAAYLYKKIIMMKAFKVTNNILLTAACLHIIAKEYGENAPITLEEIVDTYSKLGFRVSAKAIVKTIILIKEKIKIQFKIRHSEEYIPRIVSALVRSDIVQQRLQKDNKIHKKYEIILTKIALDILSNIPMHERGGRNPFIFAAASVYAADRFISNKIKIKSVLTQHIMSSVLNIAEYSIRDHFSIIKKKMLMMKIDTIIV